MITENFKEFFKKVKIKEENIFFIFRVNPDKTLRPIKFLYKPIYTFNPSVVLIKSIAAKHIQIYPTVLVNLKKKIYFFSDRKEYFPTDLLEREGLKEITTLFPCLFCWRKETPCKFYIKHLFLSKSKNPIPCETIEEIEEWKSKYKFIENIKYTKELSYEQIVYIVFPEVAFLKYSTNPELIELITEKEKGFKFQGARSIYS